MYVKHRFVILKCTGVFFLKNFEQKQHRGKHFVELWGANPQSARTGAFCHRQMLMCLKFSWTTLHSRDSLIKKEDGWGQMDRCVAGFLCTPTDFGGLWWPTQ